MQDTPASRTEWIKRAQEAEALGFDVFLVPDHIAPILSAIPAIAAAAMATERIHVGSLVFDTHIRPPALLAHECITLDVLSNGRLEIGLGAGHARAEYDAVGLGWNDPALRVERLIDAVRVVKAVLEGGGYEGPHHRVGALPGLPSPVQRPRPPILVGGGGRRLLSFAAREADIVGVIFRSLPDGSGPDPRDLSEASFAEKVAWVRHAAGDREQVELQMLIQRVVLDENPEAAAGRQAAEWDVTEEEVLKGAYVLLGTHADMEDRLRTLRDRYGVSYFAVFDRDQEAFAPLVKTLRGK